MNSSEQDVMMEEETPDHVEMNLSNATLTIDPSVVSSRILQSPSLQKEEQTSEEQPHFPKLSAVQASGNRVEYRRVRCPPHRYTPLREHWEQILTPLVEYLKLQVRRLSNEHHAKEEESHFGGKHRVVLGSMQTHFSWKPRCFKKSRGGSTS